MSIPIHSQSNSKNMINCYFQLIDSGKREAWCIGCTEKRKVDILFIYEEGKQWERYKDVYSIVNSIFGNFSLVEEEQSKCLKRIGFHKCTFHERCKLPPELASWHELAGIGIEVENCRTCQKNEEKCVVAEYCCFEEDPSLPKVDLDEKSAEAIEK